MPSRWPTVLRQRHLETMSSALRASGGTRGVVLTGGAGVGKTTLARHAINGNTGTTRWLAGTETARGIPLGAFAHLVDVADPREPHSILRAARQHLLSGSSDVLIGVDDAHMLDQLSATVVHQLALEHAANFVVTVRTGQEAPDAITALWKDGLLTRVDLAPFSRQELVELVETVLEGSLESVSADRLYAISQGNPLFLRHLVEGALEAGNLRRVAGVWQLRGETVINPHLSALVESRLADLSQPTLAVVEHLAFGGSLEAEVVTSLHDHEAVEAAERAGLTQVSTEKDRLTVALTHPIYGEVVRARTGVLKARRIRGELVGALATGRPPHVSDRIRLVSLALDSDRPPDLGALIDTAGAALTLGDVVLSERFARRAGELGGGFRSSLVLAQALVWQGHSQDSENVLAAIDLDALNEIELLTWATTRASTLFWMLNDPVKATAVIDTARARLTLPIGAGFLEMLRATFTDQLPEAVEAARAVQKSPYVTPIVLAWATFTEATASVQVGHLDGVDALVQRGLAGLSQSPSGLLRFNLGLAEVLAAVAAGDLDGAEAAARRFVGFAVGQQPARAKAGVLLGYVLLQRGKLAGARTEFVQAVAALQNVGYSWEFFAAAYLCQTCAALGLASEGADALRRAEGLVGGNVAVLGSELDVSRAWQAGVEGRTSAAVEHTQSAAAIAAKSGRVAMQASALFTAVRFGDRAAATELIEFATGLEGDLAAMQVAHAEAFAADDAAKLAAVATRWEDAGFLVAAADAAAQSAIAFTRAGDRRGELASSAVAFRLSQACDGAKTPALVVESNPLPLTAREREIASLVGMGLSNKEIADRLTVSVRTVEGHIYRSCIKLDVADRDGLAEAVKHVFRQ
ncbi:helix-turn-helix transcriptional regulator [Antrihabitans cavernicola]|nr:LuxR family transcriptional regulator [Spelaeibacter cavernicola]